jgi:NAD(P)-dependent dehydrogenase (short-subunit alcohol dehydrogenase family)
MDITGSVALVTGANRGIGRIFAQELLARGAAKVYATSRRPELVDVPGVEVLRLDVTDPESVAAAAETAGDVTLLINNAGISTGTNLVTGDLATIRLEMETQFFGALNTVRAFAPALGRNGGGAIVNVLSALSWFAADGAGAYAAAKAAQWSLTNSVRLELADQGTLVTGVYMGVVDTDMSAFYDGPKITPQSLVGDTLDAVQAGDWEVLADDWARHVKASLAAHPREFYAPQAG